MGRLAGPNYNGWGYCLDLISMVGDNCDDWVNNWGDWKGQLAGPNRDGWGDWLGLIAMAGAIGWA
jgi:hypothetical protein